MTTAAHVWGTPAPLTQASARLEVARLEAAIAGWQNEIDTMESHADIPPHQLILRQTLSIGWAKTELKTARAALENLKE